MNRVYILMCEVWGGNSYGTELIAAYTNKEKAELESVQLQGNVPTCDTRYWVEVVEVEE